MRVRGVGEVILHWYLYVEVEPVALTDNDVVLEPSRQRLTVAAEVSVTTGGASSAKLLYMGTFEVKPVARTNRQQRPNRNSIGFKNLKYKSAM